MSDWKVTTGTTGMDAIIRDLKAAGNVEPLAIEIRHSAGPARTANKNAKIAAIQKQLGRNPWFLTAAELRKMQPRLVAAVEQISAGHPRAIHGAAEAIGKDMVAAYRAHIAAGKNPRGSMRKLTKAGSIRKAKKHGHQPPILVDTGELRDSLTWRIVKL